MLREKLKFLMEPVLNDWSIAEAIKELEGKLPTIKMQGEWAQILIFQMTTFYF